MSENGHSAEKRKAEEGEDAPEGAKKEKLEVVRRTRHCNCFINLGRKLLREMGCAREPLALF